MSLQTYKSQSLETANKRCKLIDEFIFFHFFFALEKKNVLFGYDFYFILNEQFLSMGYANKSLSRSKTSFCVCFPFSTRSLDAKFQKNFNIQLADISGAEILFGPANIRKRMPTGKRECKQWYFNWIFMRNFKWVMMWMIIVFSRIFLIIFLKVFFIFFSFLSFQINICYENNWFKVSVAGIAHGKQQKKKILVNSH